MRAVVCHNFGESTVERIPDLEPGPHEALVRVARVQLSFTECQIYDGVFASSYVDVRERVRSGDDQVFGHEFCGEVVSTGTAVERVTEGDRVYALGEVPCGSCAYCDADRRDLCSSPETVGMQCPGALAEYVAVPFTVLRTLPKSVTDAEGAALQPLAAAVVCVDDAGVEPGDVVSVVGIGVMGYQLGQLALIRGASRVFVTDVDARKLRIASE